MTFILKVQMKFEIEHYFKNFLSVCSQLNGIPFKIR